MTAEDCKATAGKPLLRGGASLNYVMAIANIGVKGMVLSDGEMDNLVFEILLDCWSVNPPLERNEVAQHVIDQVSENIRKEVYASLERMVENGRIRMNSGPSDPPCRYSIPPGAAGAH